MFILRANFPAVAVKLLKLPFSPWYITIGVVKVTFFLRQKKKLNSSNLNDEITEVRRVEHNHEVSDV